MFRRVCRASALLALSFLALPGARADALGVSFSGNVVAVDLAAATTTLLQSTGLSFNALTAAGDGSDWSVDRDSDRLVSLDATTGSATLGATLSGFGGTASIRGLALAGGALYAIHNAGGETNIGADALYRLDTVSGVATLLGATGYTGVQALEADAAGNLWAWDVGSGLLRIDAATGAGTDISSAATVGDIQTLAFSAGGVLYGARNALYTIDTTSGAATLVATFTGSPDLRGLASVSAVPEPAGWALLGAGLALLAVRARSRRGR